jgi:hypothetical protein
MPRASGAVPILEDEFAIVLDANGVELRIQKVQTLTPQPQTQLGWSVISLEEVVRALRAKGVVLESSPVIGAKCDSPATRGGGSRRSVLHLLIQHDRNTR